MTTPQARYYKKRFNNDKDFHDKECKRLQEFRNNKYQNDEEYRNMIKKRSLDFYYRKKAEKENLSSN